MNDICPFCARGDHEVIGQPDCGCPCHGNDPLPKSTEPLYSNMVGRSRQREMWRELGYGE